MPDDWRDGDGAMVPRHSPKVAEFIPNPYNRHSQADAGDTNDAATNEVL